jgi:hypothetical protein
MSDDAREAAEFIAGSLPGVTLSHSLGEPGRH